MNVKARKRSLRIVEIGENTSGDVVYELRTNRDITIRFVGCKDDNLATCLQKAAMEVEKEDLRRKKLQGFIKGHTAEGSVRETAVVGGCTTHHHACDCREKAIQELCELYLREHEKVKAFTAGFGKREQCECDGCVKARMLVSRTV